MMIKNIHVRSFSSTDEGISFFVEKNDWKIFHAGDFNWWHWKGDTKENNAFAKKWICKTNDAFIWFKNGYSIFSLWIVRLEEFLDLGVIEFCKVTEVKKF